MSSFIKRIPLIGILLLCNIVFANNFVFNEDDLFVKKSVDFVEKVSNELFNKTGIGLYVFTKNSLEGKNYDEFKNEFISKLKTPFAVIILIKEDKKIDIIASDNNLFDRKKVYWEYIVPLIPQKDSDITPQSISAVILNGYIESVDLIADKYGVQIAHNVSKDEKGAKMVSQLILYFMLFSMLGILLLIYIFRNKGKE